MEKVAAIVVTFNRKQLLAQGLEALRCQDRPIDYLIVVDNASTDGTEELFREGFTGCGFEYIRLPANLGGAGGFHAGVRRGVELGFSWLWLMDDDVTPAPDCLRQMLQEAKDPRNAGFSIFQPNRIDEASGTSFRYATRYNFVNPFKLEAQDHIVPSELPTPTREIVSIPFEGPLIKLEVFRDVGEVDPEFFIICDDADFALRAYRGGHKTAVVRDALLTRASLTGTKKAFFDWKDYYTMRNRIEIDLRYGSLPLAVTRALWQYQRTARKIATKSKARGRDYQLLWRAMRDGFTRVRGKTIDPARF